MTYFQSALDNLTKACNAAQKDLETNDDDISLSRLTKKPTLKGIVQS